VAFDTFCKVSLRRFFWVPTILRPNLKRAVKEQSLVVSRFKPLLSAASSSGLSLSYRRSPIRGPQVFTPFNRIFGLLGEDFKLWPIYRGSPVPSLRLSRALETRRLGFRKLIPGLVDLPKEPSELMSKLAEPFFLEFGFDIRGKPGLVERASVPQRLFAFGDVLGSERSEIF
jgi:hypothetical protein